MKKARARQRRIGAALPGTVLFLCCVFLIGGCDREEIVLVARPDIVSIDAISVFGGLERPAVLFPHDLHTAALAVGGKGCDACHLDDDKGALVPKFMRLEDTDRDEVTAIYHDGCIECHKEKRDQGSATGPVVCGDCHRIAPVLASSRMPVGFDHSLHHRHIEACKEKCAECHHEVKDETLAGEKTIRSCRDCHRGQTIDKSPSMRLVSHKSCIGCHGKKAVPGEGSPSKTGPVACAGCHDGEMQAAIVFLADVPRLKADQPDTVLIRPGAQGLARARMMGVRFDHKAHEAAATNCRVCHHESLRACRDCHTMAGSAEGAGVTLENAMHDPASSHSCLGCHGEKKRKARCAGCHVAIPEQRLPEGSCAFCHNTPLAGAGEGEPVLPVPAGAGFTLPDGEIPEEIEIGALSDRFGPARFPHRLIIDLLRAGAAKSGVAVHFHGNEDTLCLGCHHHSPAGRRPPLCGSCHGEPFDERAIHMPGLVGAYHLQCMGCHEAMGLDHLKSCTACHAEKAPVSGKNLPAKEEDK